MKSFQRRIWPIACFVTVAATAVIVTTPSGAASLQEAFIAENDAAMDKMMSAMAIKPSASIDHDFAAMMIPHHQGAIEMAQAELRYGSNEQLRRIAQEIIVDQQQEIAAMNFALDQPLPPSMPSPTQVSAPAATQPPTTDAMPDMPGMHHHHATN
jgi:hypothetical protein